jgi:hypothetical protein
MSQNDPNHGPNRNMSYRGKVIHEQASERFI